MNLSSLACPNRAGMNVLGAACENQKALISFHHLRNKAFSILIKMGALSS
jgi:hypothetical protein